MSTPLICYPGIARPGHSYPLTSHWVNAGTRTETITPHVVPAAAAYWIRVNGSVTLAPGQSADIPVTLWIPPGAPSTVYEAGLAGGGTMQEIGFGVGYGPPPGCAPPAGWPAGLLLLLLMIMVMAGILTLAAYRGYRHFRPGRWPGYSTGRG